MRPPKLRQDRVLVDAQASSGRNAQCIVCALHNCLICFNPHPLRGDGLYHSREGVNESQVEFCMRAEAGEDQAVGVDPINQHQIGPDMAIAVSAPVAAQCVVAVPGFKWLIGGQCEDNLAQIGIKHAAVRALGLAFEIPLEGSRPLNRPHGGRRTVRQRN